MSTNDDGAVDRDETMTTIDLDQLANVNGGMKWEQLRPSTNVDDRRGLSRYESMHVRTPPVEPLPPLVRTPGDLSSQIGLDHIDVPRHRRRR